MHPRYLKFTSGLAPYKYPVSAECCAVQAPTERAHQAGRGESMLSLLNPLMKNYLQHIQTLHRSCAKQVQLMGYCVCNRLACRWQVQVYLSCTITHVLSDSLYTALVAHVSSNDFLHFDNHVLQMQTLQYINKLALLVVVKSSFFQQSCHGSLIYIIVQCLLWLSCHILCTSTCASVYD